jgi:hypothetical protein
MLTEIRCEICINHFVEIIFTLSCAVVDINLLQIKTPSLIPNPGSAPDVQAIQDNMGLNSPNLEEKF